MKFKSTVGRAIRALGHRSLALGNRFEPTADSRQEQRVKPWVRIQGDKNLRLNYDLDEHALVFDVGGYEGQWTSDIFAKYCCRVWVFEPVAMFAKQIALRFAQNSRVRVFDFGLASGQSTLMIAVDADGSSLYRIRDASRTETARLVRASDFFLENDIQRIDLIKINCEGGEYDLLEHLIETGFVKNIRDIQVQFHEDLVPNAEVRMAAIQMDLAKTHSLTYQYEFVWENWQLKHS